MFANLIDTLTPCPFRIRAMGYLREAIGIRRRYRRCRPHWQEHIDHCRSTILEGMQRCENRRKALILGAGMLHDVPLDDLAAAFERVLLVDVVHPLTSRMAHARNVERVNADVTNTLAELYRVSDEPEKPLPLSVPNLFLNDPEIDFTVSLNLLSQLPCMPLAYLARYRAHKAAATKAYARDVIQAHLDYLTKLSDQVVLITDIERLKIDAQRRVVERKDLLFGLTLPKQGKEWEWRLAPCPEADPQHDFFRRVVGISDWK